MIFINASNVHQGGGKILLEALLKANDSPCVLYSDQRLNIEVKSHVHQIQVSPTIFKRIYAEFDLYQRAKKTDQVLCFGNLPLLLPSKARTYLFFQNMILLKKNAHMKFSFKEKLKHHAERLWLKWGLSKVEKVLVQSKAVRDEFLAEFPFAKVDVLPFIGILSESVNLKEKEFDFIYVSSGDPHKNHQNLLEAWKILAQEKIFPSLVLTVASNYRDICRHIDELKIENLKIYNKPELLHSEVLTLYSQTKALIYPSFIESFGLPLIEAQQMGIPIIASELDYVREFVEPAESFDPHSAKSIARAVKRFLKISEVPQKIYSATEFLEIVFNK